MFNQNFLQAATSPIGILVLLALLLVVAQCLIEGITYLWKIRKYDYKEAKDLLARQNYAWMIIIVLIIVDAAYFFFQKRIVEEHVTDGNALLVAVIFANSVFLYFSLCQLVARYLAKIAIQHIEKIGRYEGNISPKIHSRISKKR